MATQLKVIQTFMKSLDTTNKKGSAAIDEAIRACSSFKNTQAVINKMVSDCKSYNAADKTNGWENFLLEKIGINLDNRDTGAITGSDAGGSKVKTAESIVPENISLKKFEGNSFKVNGYNLTVKLAGGGGKNATPKEITFNDLKNSDQKFIWQSLYTYWMNGGLDLVAQSYGNNFSFKSENKPDFNTLYIIFDNEDTSRRARTLSGPNTAKECKITPELHINMKFFSNLSGSSGGNSDGEAHYLDRTIAHELTHALMMDNVNYFFFLPQFIAEGTADLVTGIDDTRESFIIKLAKDSSLLKSYLNVNDTTSDSNYTYAAGYMFLRYLAKQASTQGKTFNNSTKNKSIVGGANDDTLKNSADNVTLTGGKGNNYFKNNGGNKVKILGGDGADQIYTYGSQTSINTGAGDDFVYLYKSASNVTLTAGTGNNEIHSVAQTARITTNSGNDYIWLYNSATKNTVHSGNGNDSIYSGAQVASINAGAGNDKIHLYSQAKNTTVNAGTGNDSIISYATNGIVYQYAKGDGNDTITGITAKDTLNISGSVYSTQASGNDLLVKVESGSLLLKGAKNTKFSIKGTLDGGNSSTTLTVTNSTKSPVNVGSTIKTIDATKRTTNVNIKGNALANSIKGGAGNDSIWGGAGNDTITGGKGNYKIYGETVMIISSTTQATIHSMAARAMTPFGAAQATIKFTAKATTINFTATQEMIRSMAARTMITSGAEKITTDLTAATAQIQFMAALATISSGDKPATTPLFIPTATATTLSTALKTATS